MLSNLQTKSQLMSKTVRIKMSVHPPPTTTIIINLQVDQVKHKEVRN